MKLGNQNSTLLSLDTTLEQTIRNIGIPPRPEILERIATEMGKDEPNFRYLSHLVDADVGLSASLIKTANSSFFGFRSHVRSANGALMMLGLDVASRAIAGISLRTAFPGDARLDKFWLTSAQIAALSGWLTQIAAKGRLRADDAHTYGLFRDCGVPVMLKRFPSYEKILASANDDAERLFTEVEQQGLDEFPIDHAMVGCLLAKNWWLPEETCLAIHYHHDMPSLDPISSDLPEASRYLIAIGHTAEHILEELSGERYTREWAKLGASCLRLLEFSETELQGFYDSASAVLKSVE